MIPKTLKYVSASEVLQDLSAEAWEWLLDDYISWGNNTHTMISRSILIQILDTYVERDEASPHDKKIGIILATLHSLPDDVFVDMET